MSDSVARLNAALEGRYLIERELGQGGMATVYLADDIKHERKVALKVLKPELAAVVGAERFLAEIKTTANLTHPHILPLHDSGEADSFVFYVMPYVEGESLRDRLDREHQLPVDEAVKIATDLAEALDYAHRNKVIHRDIKPANILMHEGRPLIADFGIALAVGTAGGGRLTETGLSLGTPYYMSPEQATGEQFVGAATDTYALGVMLYEMLVGDPPYMGSTAQAVLGQIIAGKSVTATEKRPSVPANVEAALQCALEKLPADRFSSTQKFGSALGDEHFRYGEVAAAGVAEVATGPWNRLTRTFAVTTIAFASMWGWSLRPEPPAPPPPVSRFSSPFEEGQTPAGGMAFTRDGSGLVYGGLNPSSGDFQLWTRNWAELDARPIRGTEGAVSFVLSPDGREVAFAAGVPGPLRVVSLEGGPSRTVLDLVLGVWDWSPEGNLYFTDASLTFQRIPVSAGSLEEAEVVSEVRDGEFVLGLLDILPGGTMGVLQVWHTETGENSEIWAIDLETNERRFLVNGGAPRYAASGHLLWGRTDGILMAAPIDVATAELTGPAVAVVSRLSMGAVGTMSFAISENGWLTYLERVDGVDGAQTEMVWVSRSGDATPVDPGWRFPLPLNNWGWSLSPDGTRVAFTRVPEGGDPFADLDIWIKGLPDGDPEQLTYDDQLELSPEWSPDGEYVTYVKGIMTELDVWQSRADGTGAPELVLDDDRSLVRGGWSPGGDWMVFRTNAEVGGPPVDIVGFRPGVDDSTTVLVGSEEFEEGAAKISPDGRWLAYTSNEGTGSLLNYEVYVRPFPIVDSDPVKISRNGGMNPRWAHSGRGLFFIDGDGNMISVAVQTNPDFRVLQRETLFTISPQFLTSPRLTSFDVSPDDQRFLMVRRTLQGGGDATRTLLVQNFFEVLRERVGN